jgi:hypothetical protein
VKQACIISTESAEKTISPHKEMVMMKVWRLLSEETLQVIVLLSLSVIVLVLTGIMCASNSAAFQRFFGRIHPLLVVFIVVVLGLILFPYLLSNGEFAVYERGNSKGLLLAIGLAVPFAAAIILVDRTAPFPVDTNVPFPDSMLFYPVMGYVAEILFQILPFCLVYFVLSVVLGESSKTRITWVAILIAALIEPIFQVVFSEGQPVWAVAYVGLHVFLICLVQMLLFRRYDFFTMYSFRLAYYALWHILWGHLRLNLLF